MKTDTSDPAKLQARIKELEAQVKELEKGRMSFEPGMLALSRMSTYDARMSQRKSAVDGVPHVGTTSTNAACMSLITTMVGSGVLGFPALFAKGGWCITGPLLFINGLAGHLSLLDMSWVLTVCDQRALKELASLKISLQSLLDPHKYSFGRYVVKYEDMAEVPFGKPGIYFASFMVNSFLLFLSGAYLILIGSSLEFVTNAWLPYRHWVLVLSVLFLPLVLLDDMTAIARLAGVGVAASIMYVLTISQAGIMNGIAGMGEGATNPPEYKLFPEENLMFQVGMIISVLLLGFSCQMVVPAVRSEMEFKEELPKATTGAMVVVMTVYGLAGLTGYFGFGNAVEGNVQVSMLDPETGTMLFAGALLACSVVANLTVTYPIVMHCVNRACEAAMKTGYSLPVRLCLFAFTVFGALVCPYFLEMLGILGSFNGVFAGIGIPLACKWKLYSEDGIPKEINRCYLFIRDGMITALSLIALFLGSYQAVSDMSAAFASGGGNPFATFNDPMSPPREPNPLSE